MHTRQSSTPSSEFSLVSSLDNLTLSASQDSTSSSPVIVDHSTRPSPAASTSLSPSTLSSSRVSDALDGVSSTSQNASRRPSGSSAGAGRTDSEFEVILVPSPVQRKQQQMDSSSRAATPTKPKGKAKAPSVKVEPDATPRKAIKGKSSTTSSAAAPSVALPGASKGKAPIVVKEEPSTSASSTAASVGDDVAHRKTRRGGRRNRARLERAQVRDILKADPDTTPTTSPSLEPNRLLSGGSNVPDLVVESYRDLYEEDSEDGASRFLDEGELDDESEVDGMSVLQGMGGAVPSMARVVVRGSVMSSEDAKCSIDSFLSGDPEFMRDKANKLRLWQALCIELGLVEVPSDLPDLPVIPPSQSTIPEPTFPLPTFPLPSSLAQARKVLKENAHINLSDYLVARSSGAQQYRHLLYPSERAMKKYTSKEKKFVPLPSVKEEWLEPLLKDFGFKRSRGAV